MKLCIQILFQSDGIEIEDEFQKCTSDKGGGQMGREVVVKEQLAAHKIEGQVVGGPGEEEEARAVVEAGASAWAIDWGVSRRRKNYCL